MEGIRPWQYQQGHEDTMYWLLCKRWLYISFKRPFPEECRERTAIKVYGDSIRAFSVKDIKIIGSTQWSLIEGETNYMQQTRIIGTLESDSSVLRRVMTKGWDARRRR